MQSPSVVLKQPHGSMMSEKMSFYLNLSASQESHLENLRAHGDSAQDQAAQIQ